jgi:hypothetical protein
LHRDGPRLQDGGGVGAGHDAAGTQEGNRRDVPDLGQQGEQRPEVGGEIEEGSLVPAGLGSLDGQQIGAGIGGDAGFGRGGDGDRHPRADPVQPVDHGRGRTAEGEAHQVDRGRLDDVELLLEAIVVPSRLPDGDSESRGFGLEERGIPVDLLSVTRGGGNEEVDPER